LTKSQKEEVLDLASEGLDAPLPPDKERRLRALVVHEVPLAARVSWSELHRTATFMVGVWSFTGSLDSEIEA